MVCNGTTDVRIKLPISNIVFTEGATSNVTTQPSYGVIEVKENQTAPIPLIFNTTVSSNSEAGEYTQSLVVTAEIQ
uniref:Fimbrial protein n=1 Tax=Yersinia enterocolitica TaxID=630 RepID=F2Q836_YEREN|nr:hypothetical protein Y69_0054 [Yersinia enterocolitica]